MNIFVLSQIKVAMDTQRSFESLLDEITADIDKTKKETSKQVVRLFCKLLSPLTSGCRGGGGG
jgi:hypothetical protein